MRRSRIAVLATAVLAAAGAGALLAVSQNADAATTASIPEHVFAPYFETFNHDSPAALASQSGDKFLTLAFLQTPAAGSCEVDWNGDATTPVADSTYGSDIAAIRAAGGDVIPSFGGFGADDTGTELADSCTSVDSIAAQFEKVITTYQVTRLDLDIEDKSLTLPDAIDRRNKAIRKVQDWAAAGGRQAQFTYTLPILPTGLTPPGLAVLQNAVDNGARVDVVNVMTFDYFDNQPHEMAADSEAAATALQGQLAALYPAKTAGELWGMTAVTEMVGRDDFGPSETSTLADAQTITDWARQQQLAGLSFWALQRDNGGCPGSAASGTCSSIYQSTWQFSDIMRPFTSGAASTNSRSWLPNASYRIGDQITYQAKTYVCRQAHNSQADWTPDLTPALWRQV
jgi:chitinase